MSKQKTTKSNLETIVRKLYQVQRQTPSGKWAPLNPDLTCQRGYKGSFLRMLREKLERREHANCYWNYRLNKRGHTHKSCRKLGKLRLVKLDIVKTEQRFYTPTDLKVRK